ncbi:MAG: hypothetical protein V3R64_04430 [Sphingomonadales bacterium]
MVETKDFLIHPPQGLNPEQRFIFEGIGYSIQGIEIAFKRLEKGSLNFIKDSTEITDQDRTELFLDVWSIIDRADALIQLITREEARFSTSVTKQFILDHSAARNLRNYMDHLAGNISNIVNSKKRWPPIYGALSFVSAHPNEKGEIEEAVVILVTSGSFKDKSTLPVVNPAGRELKIPVGLFQISAFDQTLYISKLYEDVKKIREFFESKIAPSARKMITEEATKKGVDIEEALSPSMEGLHVMMKVKFNSD